MRSYLLYVDVCMMLVHILFIWWIQTSSIVYFQFIENFLACWHQNWMIRLLCAQVMMRINFLCVLGRLICAVIMEPPFDWPDWCTFQLNTGLTKYRRNCHFLCLRSYLPSIKMILSHISSTILINFWHHASKVTSADVVADCWSLL